MRTVFGFRQSQVVGVAMLLLWTSAFGQVPNLLNYQGRISVNTTNFTGTGQFKFALINTGTNAPVQATATVTVSYGFVVNLSILNGGKGYTSAPTVTITDSTGSGARAYSQISGGVVTNIVVTATGSGYSPSPAVVITAPPQQTVTTTLWSNDGTSNAGGEPSTGVPLSVSRGLYSVQLGDAGLPNMLPLTATALSGTGVSLRVWFNDGTTGFQQMSPDQRLAAVAYAIMASTVPDGSITAEKIVPGAGGFLMDQTSGSTNIQTTANNSYLLTNDTVATILALPANPKVGDKVRLTGNSIGWQVNAPTGQNINGPYNPIITGSAEIPDGNSRDVYITCSGDGDHVFAAQQRGSIYYTSNDLSVITSSEVAKPKSFGLQGAWVDAATSTDGSHLVAVRGSGGIYTSSDYGTTWARQVDAPVSYWLSVASSADGSHLVAGQAGGGIFTSINYGLSWIPRPSAPNANWNSLASSADGSRLVAAQSGGIFTSSDYGATWTSRPSASSGSWEKVASSADGKHLAAINGSLITSDDYGVTWTQRQGAPGNCTSVASSSDGSRLIVATLSGSYTSSDFGNSWTLRLSSSVSFNFSVASSADGSHLVCGWLENPGGSSRYVPYTSSDYGVTWTRQPGLSSRAQFKVASSDDGRNLLAISSYGTIEISHDFGGSWMVGGVQFDQFSGYSCNWSSLAASSNGKVIIAAADNIVLQEGEPGVSSLGAVFLSTNYGARFDHVTRLPAGAWGSVASSADGNRLAVSENSGRIFTSTNRGATWLSTSPHPISGWVSVSFGTGARDLLAIGYDYSVGFSHDLGATWDISTNLTSANNGGFSSWNQSAFSADGAKLYFVGRGGAPYSFTTSASSSILSIMGPVVFGSSALACSGGGTRVVAANVATSFNVLLSPNSGLSWSSGQVAQPSSDSRPSAVSSASGSRVFVADSKRITSLRAYQYQSISGGPFSSCELVYSGNGQWQISSSTSTISGL